MDVAIERFGSLEFSPFSRDQDNLFSRAQVVLNDR
jgi:hypothetical protein